MNEEVTLEKVDIVRERTGATYVEAKEALTECEGNVVDAIIYIEKKKAEAEAEKPSSKDELFKWLKEILEKGNVTRIRVKKGGNVIVDVPVNAGVAVAAVIGIIWSELLALGLIAGFVAGAVTDLTFEIVKADGSVDVINKTIKSTASDIKEKVSEMASEFKNKVSGKKEDCRESENVYKYTVKFDDEDDSTK